MLLRLSLGRIRRRYRGRLGVRHRAMNGSALRAGCAGAVPGAIRGGRGRRVHMRIGGLRSLVFRLRRRMIQVMVASVVTLGRQRGRDEQHRRDNEHSSWARAAHIWEESQS